MDDVQIIEADWTWTGSKFESGIQVVVESDGEIEHVGMLDAKPTHRLIDRALLPGFVNVHSHAFQRGLRGHGETFPDGAGSFWTWREAMYGLVARLDDEAFFQLTREAFTEMLAAGITTVGEFHYLHHDASGDGYAFDELVLKAAAEAGIRLVLLNTYYNAGGVDRPLEEGQRRFATRTVEGYWRQMDRLAHRLDPMTQSLAAVAHSVRAASVEEIVALYKEAHRRDMVFHMHVEEQRKEIEECVAVHGRTPMALLNERLAIDESFTAVHATHTAPADMKRFVSPGGHVCLCPLTEGNLGDGIADAGPLGSRLDRICVGSDSNARISMIEELRWLEYVRRLKSETRGVFRDERGGVAPTLLAMATINGARSLGVKTGRIAPGYLADFSMIDLEAASLAGWSADTLLESIIFGADNEVVVGTCVGGKWHPSLSDGGIH